MGNAYLEVREGDQRRRVDLPEDGIVRIGRIGRDPPNQIELEDNFASRSHAELRTESGGTYHLNDTGSLKGTFVNGRPLTSQTRLRNGDTLLIGKTEIIFYATTGEKPPPSGTLTKIAYDTRLVTVLVFDIRGSTALGQNVAAETLAATFAAFNDAALAILEANGVWSKKLTGDGLMALWAHRHLVVPQAAFAPIIQCAVELGQVWTKISKSYAGVASQWGVGINTGMAELGNMGARQSQDFMPVHDTVNRAFRLEAATKSLGKAIVIGKTCFDFLDPRPASLPDGVAITLAGYNRPEIVHPLHVDAAAALAARFGDAAKDR